MGMLETPVDLTPEDGQGAAESAARLIARVGVRVREARKMRAMSRRELSERSGVSPRYLAKLEGGDGNISIGLLQRVALALETPVEFLLMETSVLAPELVEVAELYRTASAEARTRALHVLDPMKGADHKAQRLCLVGLRGAGKSTLGARMGKAFDAPFIELNAEIEATAGIPLGEIIALYGQDGYRQLEADTLARIIDTHARAVIAVAGGIVSEPRTFDHLLECCHSVWLTTSAAEHMDRVRAQGDMRPMAGNPQAMAQLQQILAAREAIYARADHALDTSGKSVDESHKELAELIAKTQILGPAPV